MRVTLVHHVATNIKRSADETWQFAADRARSGQRFSQLGYRIEPLTDDPSAFLGGYRIWIDGTDREDERRCRITEWNEPAMRLSMCAEYLDPRERGTTVYATYSVTPTADGCRYAIDCHAALDVEADPYVTQMEMQKIIEVLSDEHCAYLKAGLDEMRAYLECCNGQSVLKVDTKP